MRPACILVQLVLLLLPPTALGQAGEIWFWLPSRPGVSGQGAQVPRNTKYVSVKLHSVYVYYRSGFFENIKWVLISSELSVEHQAKIIQATFVNRTLQKSKETGDFVGLGDHLAWLSPATPPGVKLRVTFRGVGEDRFKKIFDVLADKDFKMPLSLSDAVVGRVTGLASIVRRFLGTPYTSENPRNILDMSQSFVLYSDASYYVDSLREGYMVVFSAQEKKGADLSKVLQSPPDQLRLGPQGQDLQYMDSGGAWRSFTGNSYVIFSITQTPVRGADQNSPWFRKYAAAERAAEKIVTGDSLEKVKKEAWQLWSEGNTLLDADASYIQEERKLISADRWKAIDRALRENLERAGIKATAVLLAPPSPEVPTNFEEMASRYDQMLASLQGRIVLRGFTNVWAPNLKITRADNPRSFWIVTPDVTGTADLRDVFPGDYVIQALAGDSPVGEVTSVSVDPGEVVSLRATKKGPDLQVARDPTKVYMPPM
ncbi:MAG: hypothetical protein L0212_05190 [Acidobacteria bacterium]|nr:hypothetical protein [Acidobacteriota bacterium]